MHLDTVCHMSTDAVVMYPTIAHSLRAYRSGRTPPAASWCPPGNVRVAAAEAMGVAELRL